MDCVRLPVSRRSWQCWVAVLLIATALLLYITWQSGPGRSTEGLVLQQDTQRRLSEDSGSELYGPKATRIHRFTPIGHNFHWVATQDTSLNITSRLSAYNREIAHVRSAIMSERGDTGWHSLSDQRNVLWCNNDNFMEEVQHFDQVQTVVLPWQLTRGNADQPVKSSERSLLDEETVPAKNSMDAGALEWSSLGDRANLVIQKYYRWIASEPLCQWIQTPGYTKARWDAVYNQTCRTDTSLALPPASLEILYLYGKPINPSHYWPNNGSYYPSYFYTELPDRLLYLHTIQDAVITVFGDVISGNLKLVPYSCSQDIGADAPANYGNTPIWNEVFVITQFWGDAFFHKMLEIFPRVAPYLEFLQANKHIKIHVAEPKGYTRASLKFLGLNPERIISDVSRAKLVYLPQATPCGFAQALEIQLLSKLYRDRIKSFGLGVRNLIVLVQRTGHRKFKLWEEIAFLVEKISGEYGWEYMLFPDNPSLPMEQSMQAFNQAVMIVAPHGAGLANMVYSEPGTFVIEGVCNPPHVNMCFQWTAHVLGHRYHGIPSRGGCEDVVDVEPQVLGFVMRLYLEQIKDVKPEDLF